MGGGEKKDDGILWIDSGEWMAALGRFKNFLRDDRLHLSESDNYQSQRAKQSLRSERRERASSTSHRYILLVLRKFLWFTS